MILRYDGSEVLNFSHKLVKIHRAALPNAVRFTLNQAAFDVKKHTLQTEAQSFTQRKPSFFKRFSGVEQATGFNIGNMRSSVGMIENNSVQATKDIAVQETGGSINRKTVMLPGSRTGGRGDKAVSSKYRGVGGFKDRTAARGKKNFLKAAFASEGKKKPDLMRYIAQSGKGYMIEVQKITVSNGRVKIKSKIVSSFDDDRSLHIKANPFVERASLNSAKKINQLFRENAIRQIKKYS